MKTKKILMVLIACLMLIGCTGPKNMVKPDGTPIDTKLAHAIDVLHKSKVAYNVIFRTLAIAKDSGEITQMQYDVAAKVGREYIHAYEIAAPLVLEWYETDTMTAVVDVSDVLKRLFRLALDMGALKPEVVVLIEVYMEVINEFSVTR